MAEVKEKLLYLDSEPVRRCRAAGPGGQLPPETRCASSSAPAAQKRINEAARKTNGPVRRGEVAAHESHQPSRQSESPACFSYICLPLKEPGPQRVPRQTIVLPRTHETHQFRTLGFQESDEKMRIKSSHRANGSAPGCTGMKMSPIRTG